VKKRSYSAFPFDKTNDFSNEVETPKPNINFLIAWVICSRFTWLLQSGSTFYRGFFSANPRELFQNGRKKKDWWTKSFDRKPASIEV